MRPGKDRVTPGGHERDRVGQVLPRARGKTHLLGTHALIARRAPRCTNLMAALWLAKILYEEMAALELADTYHGSA